MTVSPSNVVAVLQPIFGACPDVALVTLFGSCAKGKMSESSDIDLLIWLMPTSKWTRHDLWDWFDSQQVDSEIMLKASLVVKHWRKTIFIDTLLLDMPEEHVVVYDPQNLAPGILTAIRNWRKKSGAKKIPSFNGTHAWKYSSIPGSTLASMDFSLEMVDVA